MPIKTVHRLLAVAALALLPFPPALAASFGPSAPGPNDRLKVRVADPAIARELVEGGAQLIADYGAFQFLEVGRSAIARFGPEAVEDRRGENLILLNAGAVDTVSGPALAGRRLEAGFAGRRLHLVQFAGPVKPAWYEELEAAGVRVVTYLPHNAYLVFGDAPSLARLQAMARSRAFVQWEGAYQDGDRIQPAARLVRAKAVFEPGVDDLFAVQLVDDPEANGASVPVIQALGLAPVQRDERALGYRNLVVRLPPDQLEVVASLPDVVSIQAHRVPRKFDERQDQVVAGNVNAAGSGPTNAGYLAWLYSKGFTQSQFTASGFVVDVTDSGVDNGTNRPNHFGLYAHGDTGQPSRVIYNRLQGTPNAGSTIQGCDGHGNLNAHIVGGYNDRTNWPHVDSGGYRYGLGVCPFVKLASSVVFDPDYWTYPDYEDMLSRGYRDGARISSDSWGASVYGDYDVDCQQYDALVRDAQPAGSAVPSNGNQEITIVFSAGNDGPGGTTIGSPGTAKNVITVGAGENPHSHSSTNGGNNASGNDGCYIPDSEANSANDIASFSSRGPCTDSRRKPDLVAPGTHITGGVAQQNRVTTGTGDDLACFDGTGVCALPGSGVPGDPDNFFPTGQQFYTTSSGTSHSTPAVAGGCALLRQYFLNQGLNAPSPAMLKAFLLNSARYLTGVSANDTLWSNNQGMGGMDLGMALDGAMRVLHDQLTNELFTATGQSEELIVTILETGKPFRVTLAWTDAPGPTTGSAYKNNLDLTVAVGANTYRGNVFSGRHSVTGGAADIRNNVESVFLPSGQVGVVYITVSAANINSDGVPNYGGALDQDFALVVYNAVEGGSNQPPMLSRIGNRSAATNQLMEFNVTAIDPLDHDPITMWATGVPPWAAFATVTNLGAVTNTFSGMSSETGTWYTTFFAGDKDGTNSETIRIRVDRGALGGGLFISQYYEGSLQNKWIELFNASDSNLDLLAGGYRLGIWSNARREEWKTDGVPTTSIPLSGTALATNTFLIGHSLATIPSYAVPDLSSGSLGFSGDDSVILYRGATYRFTNVVDAFGLTGNTAMNRSFVRTNAVIKGTNVDVSAAEWIEVSTPVVDIASEGTPERLGYHSVVGGASSEHPPVLNPIGNQFVTVSNALQIAVTAVPTEGDPVTLSVSEAPPGSTFDSTNQNGTFTWTNCGPVGVYTSTFYATDDDGTVSEEIRITVRPQQLGPLNIEDWQVRDSRTPLPRIYTFASNTVSPGQYVVIGRNASRSAFESYYGVTLGDNVLYLNSSNTFPILNATYTYRLRNDAGETVDGPSGKGSVTGFTVQRDRADSDGTASTSWVVRALSQASPGSGVAGSYSAGLVLTELADATNFIYEFIELYYDAAWESGDLNGNGIPDDWELRWFGNLTNTAAGDNDGDGCNNLCEYGADTDPTNSAAVFALGAELTAGTSVELMFLGTNSRQYAIQFSPFLVPDGGWSNLQGAIAGTNGPMFVTDTNPIPPRFYRGRATPP